jgi:hypothetical protein
MLARQMKYLRQVGRSPDRDANDAEELEKGCLAHVTVPLRRRTACGVRRETLPSNDAWRSNKVDRPSGPLSPRATGARSFTDAEPTPQMIGAATDRPPFATAQRSPATP